MQTQLNLPRKSLRALVAVMLAMGIALTPSLAFADEQPSDDQAQQVTVLEGEDGSGTDTALPQDDSDETNASTVASAPTDEQGATDEAEAAGQDEGDTDDASAGDQPDDEVGTQTEGNDQAGTSDTSSDDASAVDSQQEDASSESEALAPADEDTDASTIAATVTTSDETPLTTQQAVEYQTVADGTYIFETDVVSSDGLSLAKLVLDARNGATEGADIITWSYNGKDNQKWKVTQRDSSWYSIASLADESLVITAAGTEGKLYLTTYISGLASQLWAFLLNGTSYGTGYQMTPQGIQASATDTTIINSSPVVRTEIRNNSTKRGADIITASASEDESADLSLYLADPTPEVEGGSTELEGKYLLHVPETSLVVEVKGASTNNGANIWTWAANGKTHQDIYLKHEGSGFYSIWIMGTKKVLDVAGGCVLPGTNVVQWTYGAGKVNQQWAVRQNADGTYTFVNKATGLALGGVSEKDGGYGLRTNLAGVQDNGRTNNTFILQQRALLTAGIYKLVKTSNGKVIDVTGSSTKSGATIGFYTDKGSTRNLNQRFELVSAGGIDRWRIRTASSGGWITVNSKNVIIQEGNHATAQSANNTWQVLWDNGNYKFRCITTSGARYLGTKAASYKVTKAPIGFSGLFKITSMAASVALDDPKSSTASGTKIGVYKDKNGANQRFYVAKSGSGYKITNLVSNLALTVSGSTTVQTAFSGKATQLWTFAIADGGSVRLINNSTKKALDISGSGTISTGTTATCMNAASASRESRQGWKLTVMPLPIYEKMAQVAIHFADHNAHGYSRPNRGTGGKETITLSDGTKTTISKADIDCSEMVRQCINAAFGKNLIGYMWTGNQYSCMKSTGFKLIAFKASSVQRGDILWRTGHTCIALGDGKTSEAFGSETNDIDGVSGDQTGKEVAYGTVGTNWTYIYRWVKTVD